MTSPALPQAVEPRFAPSLATDVAVGAPSRTESWFGLPWTTLAPILLLIAAVDAAVLRLSFAIPEGATGAMRTFYPPLRVFLLSLGSWCAFLPFLAMAQRIASNADSMRRMTRLGAHAAVAVLGAPLYAVLRECSYYLVTTVVAGGVEAADLHRQTPFTHHVAAAFGFVSTYGSAALLTHYVRVRRLAAERAAKSLEMEYELTRAQLRMLRMQLQPHFLFNSLNAVLSLVREDQAACESMILSLTRFLRKTLEDEGRALVPLEHELGIVCAYLEVERQRFPDRFTCEIVADEEARRQLVPALLLQPLVENAVRHGFSGLGRRGLLRIVATLGGGRLHLSVQDDGAGAEASSEPGHGLGLSLARERLKEQFGEAATFEAGVRASGGFQIFVSFPALA